jgi:predicted NAD-dependent protein-ADP-ribosyltransferase YbiA (DUF1768 family)
MLSLRPTTKEVHLPHLSRAYSHDPLLLPVEDHARNRAAALCREVKRVSNNGWLYIRVQKAIKHLAALFTTVASISQFTTGPVLIALPPNIRTRCQK